MYCAGHIRSPNEHFRIARNRTQPAHLESALRIGAKIALPAVLRSLGTIPVEVLAEAGFDLTLFDDPDNRISYAAKSQMFEHYVTRIGCQHLWFLVCQQAGLHSLRMVGLRVKDSPDVRTALLNLLRCMHLHIRNAVRSLETGGNTANQIYEIYQSGVEATDQTGDGAVAGLFNIMRTLCGPDWKPAEVQSSHRNPERIDHRVESLVKQRVYGLTLGDEDLNDHDSLQQDHLLALMSDKTDLKG